MRDFEEALRAAQAGDERGFSALFRRFNPGLVRYLRVVAGDAADDLASETWLDAVRGLPRFEGGEPGFRGWLFTIARRRHLDWRRRQRRRPVLVSDTGLDAMTNGGDPAAATVEADGATRHALDVIARLPSEQAEVVALRTIAGLDVAEVASILGKSPGAVRVLSHRGLHRLATLLGRDVPAVEV